MNHSRFFSGTSGMVLPVPNKQHYPVAFQDKSRLSYYAFLFNSLEVNSSFYKIPMAATTQRWAASVPDHFQFTFKLFKEITHGKGSLMDETLIEKFMHVIGQVEDRAGCLLVQLPPSAAYDPSRLQKLLSLIDKFNTRRLWKVCFEFRHESWYIDTTYEMMSAFNAGLVIHDMKGSVPPLLDAWTNFIYLRFHGPTGKYNGTYTDEFLHQQADMISDWLRKNKTVYVYFNNTMGDALNNLQTLNRFIANR